MSVKQAIYWRRTIKKYDTNKNISSEHLNSIIDAGRMAPSSLGLEMVEVVAIQNPLIKETLSRETLMSSNIEKGLLANTLIYLTGIIPQKVLSTSFLSQRILRSFSHDIAKGQEMVGYMQQALQKKYPDEAALRRYISEQVHLTVGFMTLQAAEFGIGSTIMGGINETLATEKLREQGFISAEREVYLALSLGYPDYQATDSVLTQYRVPFNEFAKVI